jgi:hypothetical protein
MSPSRRPVTKLFWSINRKQVRYIYLPKVVQKGRHFYILRWWSGEGCRCRGFELLIFRLPGQGDYYTRPLGTTSSLIIYVVVYVASITYFSPLWRERRLNSSARRGRRGGSVGRGRGSCVTGARGGELDSEDVASERRKECRLRRCRSCVDSSLAVLRGQIASGSHQM